MSTAILEHFKTLTQIPHCSKEAQQLKTFLVTFAKKRGYHVLVDEAENILIWKGSPKLCLQAHYDMVCMGKAPQIETYREGDLLKAKEASLGADNGMAIAMMMQLMDEGEMLEFLLTSDEEIGLIGANALNFELQSSAMLNLDSEDEAEVYIGCAGGVDIIASLHSDTVVGEGRCYEVSVKGLEGGHSGVDIDKGIPSAIKVLGDYLAEKGVTQLVEMRAGERRNSIPANAVALVYSETPLQTDGKVNVKELEGKDKVYRHGSRVMHLIHDFQQGVHTFHDTLGIPNTSVNLAKISTSNDGISVEVSARAMSAEGLQEISTYTVKLFESYGFKVTLEDKYPSWKPEINTFTKDVSREMEKVYGKSKMMAIHAGLECGVIAEKYPHIKFASIGPTIRYPHSTREEVDLLSVKRTFEVLKNVIAHYKF
jgi:dipeptidase D